MMEERRGERDGEGGAGGCGRPRGRPEQKWGRGSKVGEMREGKVRGKRRPQGAGREAGARSSRVSLSPPGIGALDLDRLPVHLGPSHPLASDPLSPE